MIITPEAHGAVGNGTTDDTAAVAAAITAAGAGGTVYFAKTYLISTGPLAPLANQTWYGSGTIKLGPSVTTDIVLATGLTGLTLRGLTFDGNQANQTATGTALVHLVSPTNCVIENCTFQNSYGAASYVGTAAIQLRMPQYCRIRSCFISNCGYGIQLGSLNTDTTPMYGNSITDVEINTTNWDGIFLTENLGSNAATPVGYLHGTVVANCRFQQVGDAAVEVGSGCVGTVVSGCSIDNTAGTSVGNNAVIIRDSQNVTVTGCTIRNYLKSASCAIYLINLNGTAGNGKNDQFISISNCVIDTVDLGISDAAGVTGLTISGCIINKFSQTSAGSAGLKLASTSSFTITGTALTNGSGTPGSNEGLELTSAHDGTISGCDFFNNRGNDAFIINNTCYNILVTGCRFGPSNTAHALRIFDANSHDITVVGNDLSGNNTGNGVSLWSATPGANITIRSNNAVNPYGVETVAVPTSAQPVVPIQHDRTYYITNGAASSTFALAPTVASLSTALSTGAAITSLPINALNATLASGTVIVSSGTNTQTFTTTGAAVGATTISVTSATPNFAYPVGSAISAGSGVTITVPAIAVIPIRVPAGSILTPTYTSAPTWVVEGE
jgi:hypothetical protein